MTASMDRTWNGFWHCFQEEPGNWGGGGGPPAPFHRALSPAHRQKQPSGGPPAAQEGRPVGGQQGPAGWALLRGSCLGQEELPVLPGLCGGWVSTPALTWSPDPRWANPGRAFWAGKHAASHGRHARLRPRGGLSPAPSSPRRPSPSSAPPAAWTPPARRPPAVPAASAPRSRGSAAPPSPWEGHTGHRVSA